MSHLRFLPSLFLLLVVVGMSLLPACSQPSNPTATIEATHRVESAPVVAPTENPLPRSLLSPTPTPPRPAPLPPPNNNQVHQAITRIFEKAITTDASPNFVVGDFNGDGSEDLAVVVKPTEGALAEINSGVANWLLEDPHTAVPPDNPHRQTASIKPVFVEKGDILLAIIHGVGAQGWRHAEARQTFLLRNAAGSELRVQSIDVLKKSKANATLPQL